MRLIKSRTGARLVLCLVVIVAVVGLINGSVHSWATVSRTPIANCIINPANDVKIGGSDAPAGCSNAVVLEPSSSNPAALGEITIGSGGTLSLVGQAGTQTARATFGQRLIQ